MDTEGQLKERSLLNNKNTKSSEILGQFQLNFAQSILEVFCLIQGGGGLIIYN